MGTSFINQKISIRVSFMVRIHDATSSLKEHGFAIFNESSKVMIALILRLDQFSGNLEITLQTEVNLAFSACELDTMPNTPNFCFKTITEKDCPYIADNPLSSITTKKPSNPTFTRVSFTTPIYILSSI